MKQTDIRIREIKAWTEHFDYRTPMKFGGRVVDSVVILNVSAQVESRVGRSSVGFGSMTMGNAWAWIPQSATGEQTLAAMLEFAQKLAARVGQLSDFGHPLELCRTISECYAEVAQETAIEAGLAEDFPILAALVAASPFEAALFDAYGKLHGADVFSLLGEDFVNSDLSAYLGAPFSGEYLDRYVLARPKPFMPLYHLVGGLDPLVDADIPQRLDDGLPETLGEWILADGLTHLKIKLNGDNLERDVERFVRVEQATKEAQTLRGVSNWVYSADFNERCPSEEYVLEWLTKTRERTPEGAERLQYIEQPTHRDLRRLPRIEMFRAAKIRPVVIDESLVDFQTLLLARELGYSGVALKACKGLHEALLMGAAAQKFDMFLCVQDLTCPGASFLLSASLAAHIPTVAAIEGNARQYCPTANTTWAARYPTMFGVSEGRIQTGVLHEPGVGFEFAG
ncbi:MAG: mandelate racemase/muconate lactonizing enzyme family protein [Planctomycetia bacterium]|nr:mandelate racemase/muconate lactonizing enzyme family protein [Planctomycetia bacterium]